MSKEFKVGDKVYFPPKSTKVLTICSTSCSSEYPILALVDSERHPWSLTTDGKVYADDVLPSLFHATPEMKAKLEDFYGVEFEAPPVKPSSKEIIQAMLARGDKSVCCWVNDISEDPTSSYSWAFIISAFDDVFIDECGTAWEFATPFNHQTRQPITELPVGEYDD